MLKTFPGPGYLRYKDGRGTFQQISGTTTGTKFAPSYACTYMDQVEQKFHQPLIWLRYIDDMFFIWTNGEKNLEKFMSSFNSSKKNIYHS